MKLERIKNKRNILIMMSLLIVCLVVIGVSYAIWQMTLTQTDKNIVTTSCFKIDFKGENDINLENAYPMTLEEGMNLVPYTFTIENVCNTNATYQINLEELETDLKKLSDEYVSVSLNNLIGELNSFSEVNKTLLNATKSHKLTTGVLKSGEEKTFELRIWMSEDTPSIDDVMEATFLSKITVIAVHQEIIPEVSSLAMEYFDGIKIDVSTLSNPNNEVFKYFYKLEDNEEIESDEPTHIFNELSDKTYKVRIRVEDSKGITLLDKEEEVTIAYQYVYVSNMGNNETGIGSKERPFSSLQLAYNKVKSGGEVVLLTDIVATETTNMNIENKSVTLRSDGEDSYTILKDPSFTAMILDINNSNEVTTTNIIFDGNEVISSSALLEVRNSILNLNEKTTVTKNNNRGRYYEEVGGDGAIGGGIFAWKSDLNINGADITYNKTTAQSGNWSMGGGVYVNGNLYFNNGNISYNENAGAINNQYGGGIVFASGIFNMNGGTISYNKALRDGGGIYVSSFNVSTVMTINDGLITNNTAGLYGGGIFAIREEGAVTDTTVYIKGGVIENNITSNGTETYTYNGAQIIDQR